MIVSECVEIRSVDLRSVDSLIISAFDPPTSSVIWKTSYWLEKINVDLRIAVRDDANS